VCVRAHIRERSLSSCRRYVYDDRQRKQMTHIIDGQQDLLNEFHVVRHNEIAFSSETIRSMSFDNE
jgi:hypothetical protein